jgi:hypothetical protein
MKSPVTKSVFFASFLMALSLSAFAQIPQGFSYQAIARDGSGNVLANTPLPVKIDIQTSLSGGLIYEELFSSVTSNQFGLITLAVGTGSPVTGSFSLINWNQTLFIKTIIQYPGTTWTTMGTSQIWSVPYALVANDVGTLTKLGIKSATTNDDALFEVKNKGGQTVFAVYNNAVRAYVGKEVAKGARGGFSVGGYDGTKGVQDYLKVYGDSTRVYVRNQSKGVRGGFAVGGYDGMKGNTGNFMNLTKDNYFIGHESGSLINGGQYNSVIGYNAARQMTSGSYNTILGYKADSSLIDGNNNIIIGATAGFKLTSGIHNTLIGSSAGFNHTDQAYNVMIGTAAGYEVTGSYNTFVGINSGRKIRSGTNNVFLGTNAGGMLEQGDGNTIVGIDAGRSGTWDWNTYHPGNNTSHNTIIGNEAGYNLDVGSGNVYIGYKSGFYETGTIGSPSNNKLYVANSSTNPPLLFGDFTLKQLGINTTTLSKTLNVGGDVLVSGNVTAATFNGTLSGNVSGNVTGNLSGNVTGNVIGDLTGNVNGMEMGRIYLKEPGEIQSILGGTFILSFNPAASLIRLENINKDFNCNYWYRIVNGPTSTVGSGILVYNTSVDIIKDKIFDNTGFEIHFGQTNAATGYCSVWVQYYSGTLIGHYLKQ